MTRRFTSGLPQTCTGFVSRRCGIMCGPGSQGRRYGLDRGAGGRGREPAGAAGGRAASHAAYGSTAARVKAFVEQGGGCRATFFNYRRYLLK